VPVHPRLRAVLTALPVGRREWLFAAAPSTKYPDGGRQISTKRLNEQFARLVEDPGLPVGREDGYVIHSLRHFFETFTVNAGIPRKNKSPRVRALLQRRGRDSAGAVSRTPNTSTTSVATPATARG